MGGFHGTTELEEQVKTGRVQHTKICTDHWMLMVDNLDAIKEEVGR